MFHVLRGSSYLDTVSKPYLETCPTSIGTWGLRLKAQVQVWAKTAMFVYSVLRMNEVVLKYGFV